MGGGGCLHPIWTRCPWRVYAGNYIQVTYLSPPAPNTPQLVSPAVPARPGTTSDTSVDILMGRESPTAVYLHHPCYAESFDVLPATPPQVTHHSQGIAPLASMWTVMRVPTHSSSARKIIHTGSPTAQQGWKSILNVFKTFVQSPTLSKNLVML